MSSRQISENLLLLRLLGGAVYSCCVYSSCCQSLNLVALWDVRDCSSKSVQLLTIRDNNGEMTIVTIIIRRDREYFTLVELTAMVDYCR